MRSTGSAGSCANFCCRYSIVFNFRHRLAARSASHSAKKIFLGAAGLSSKAARSALLELGLPLALQPLNNSDGGPPLNQRRPAVGVVLHLRGQQ